MQSAKSFVRLPQVIDRTGLSRSTIYFRISEGSFPAPVSLGGRAVGWVDTEVHAWIDNQIKQRLSEKREQG